MERAFEANYRGWKWRTELGSTPEAEACFLACESWKDAWNAAIEPTHPADTQEERVTLQQHARVIEAMADEERRRKILTEVLSDLLDVIDEQKVEGTCKTGTCHWPAVTREAFLAREAMTAPADTQHPDPKEMAREGFQAGLMFYIDLANAEHFEDWWAQRQRDNAPGPRGVLDEREAFEQAYAQHGVVGQGFASPERVLAERMWEAARAQWFVETDRNALADPPLGRVERSMDQVIEDAKRIERENGWEPRVEQVGENENEYDYKHAPLRCIRYEVRLAVEELDRLGVEKFEDGDGTAWSLVKRIRLLAAGSEAHFGGFDVDRAEPTMDQVMRAAKAIEDSLPLREPYKGASESACLGAREALARVLARDALAAGSASATPLDRGEPT